MIGTARFLPPPPCLGEGSVLRGLLFGEAYLLAEKKTGGLVVGRSTRGESGLSDGAALQSGDPCSWSCR